MTTIVNEAIDFDNLDSAGCKRLIIATMHGLFDKMLGVDCDLLKAELGTTDLTYLTSIKHWKRSSKMKHPRGETRTFTDTRDKFAIRISTSTSQGGENSVEFEFATCPDSFQTVIDRNGGFEVANIFTATKQEPKGPSMTEGPKPEGFGMFA